MLGWFMAINLYLAIFGFFFLGIGGGVFWLREELGWSCD
jgi:hypothetical protein